MHWGFTKLGLTRNVHVYSFRFISKALRFKNSRVQYMNFLPYCVFAPVILNLSETDTFGSN